VNAHSEKGGVGDLSVAANFTFIGSPMTVSIAEFNTQRILFTGSAVLGNATVVSGVDFEVCVRDSGDPAAVPLGTGYYLTVTVINAALTYTVTDLLDVSNNGTWEVGLCYRSPADITSNDFYRTTATVITVP
jgi:hypothetical protein